MCGIAGIALLPDQDLKDLQQRTLAMRDTMTHRGPDDAGLFVSSDSVASSHNQKSFIRESPRICANEDKRLAWIRVDSRTNIFAAVIVLVEEHYRVFAFYSSKFEDSTPRVYSIFRLMSCLSLT